MGMDIDSDGGSGVRRDQSMLDKVTFLDKLRIELRIAKHSDYTVRNYVHANALLLEFTGKFPSEVNVDDVKAFLVERFSDKSASSTILFLSALKYAYSSLLGFDPTVSIRRPRREKKLPVTLTKAEIKQLLAVIRHEKSRLMVSLLYACGFRVSELVNLKLQDLVFAERVGYVRQSKGRKDRLFIIPQFLLEDLAFQVEQQRRNDQVFLFSGRSGGRMSVRNVQKMVSGAALRAGLSKSVHCHTLRHSFATHLLEQGVDIRKIQELLGHADLSTTQIYTQVSSEELKKITSPFDSLDSFD